MLNHLEKSMYDSCVIHFSKPAKKKRYTRSRGLPFPIMSEVRKISCMKDALRRYKQLNHADQQILASKISETRQQELKIRDMIAEYDIRQRARAQVNGLKAHPTSTKFWDFVRGHSKALCPITAAYDSIKRWFVTPSQFIM